MSQETMVNIPEFISRPRLSGFQMLVVGLCSLVILLDGFDTQSISFVASLLAPHLGVRVADFGPIFGAGRIGSIVGGILIAIHWDNRQLFVAAGLPGILTTIA